MPPHAHQAPGALAEINQEFWQPLRAAFQQGEITAGESCFRPNPMLASGGKPSLKEHAMAAGRGFMLRQGKTGFDLGPLFTERAVGSGLASERGIMEETGGGGAKTYDEFHAFSRQVDGR